MASQPGPSIKLTLTVPLIARVVAAGQVGFGVALVVAPRRVTSLWLGSDAERPGARVVTRGLGARDVALGVGALAAADSQLQPWVAAAIVADTADLVATVAAGKSLPLTGRVLVGAVAAGGAVLGAIALAVSVAGLHAPDRPGPRTVIRRWTP